MKTNIGGDRIGSGSKNEVSLRNYERSSHDLGYVWRSSMASGTLVPFMSELGLPGDTFDIDLDCDVKTLPTVGPLFGSYKVQLDVFECPVRLYQGKLHMNMLNIGLDMAKIKLPQMELVAKYDPTNLTDNAQVNSSSLYSYLNIRGLGRTVNSVAGNIKRKFNAVPYLGYWDIYKNYYANKQEEGTDGTVGYVIHGEDLDNGYNLIGPSGGNIQLWVDGTLEGNIYNNTVTVNNAGFALGLSTRLVFGLAWSNSPAQPYGQPNLKKIKVTIDGDDYPLRFEEGGVFQNVTLTEVPGIPGFAWTVVCEGYIGPNGSAITFEVDATTGGVDPVENVYERGSGEPQLTQFPLDNIDQMREDILAAVGQATAFNINANSIAPYGLGLDTEGGVASEDYENAFCRSSQEGLGLKTYQSDLFNNWISTEWIEGPNGVAAVTAVDTSSGEFTIDSLNLANKVYNMLNRIAISGGSYDDWLDAVYTHERAKSSESPVYHGSLIKELAFEEVISNSDTKVNDTTQPLGTLAGRGRLTRKNKGGKIRIKVNEPSYIMGIVSITPRLDYSQGNKWDLNLENMDEFHKPAMDEIGFQDLVTDQMAWFDTVVGPAGPKYESAGKQPAWINYMTNVNQCRGNFAEQEKEMFMTLNRRYDQSSFGISDLTTYVDPSKFNYIFAQKALDSQNFWCQIKVDNTARRKMSAKIMPNL